MSGLTNVAEKSHQQEKRRFEYHLVASLLEPSKSGEGRNSGLPKTEWWYATISCIMLWSGRRHVMTNECSLKMPRCKNFKTPRAPFAGSSGVRCGDRKIILPCRRSSCFCMNQSLNIMRDSCIAKEADIRIMRQKGKEKRGGSCTKNESRRPPSAVDSTRSTTSYIPQMTSCSTRMAYCM